MGWGNFLKPNWKNLLLFFLILAFGYFVWYTGYNPGCCDIPRVVGVPPILFPPLIFDEGCISLTEKSYNIINWVCNPTSCGFCPDVHCSANCNINPISLIYIPIYVYVLSSVLVYALQSVAGVLARKWGKKNFLKYFVLFLFWFVVGIYLIIGSLVGTFGIRFDLLGLILFVVIPLFVLVYISAKLIEKYF